MRENEGSLETVADPRYDFYAGPKALPLKKKKKKRNLSDRVFGHFLIYNNFV